MDLDHIAFIMDGNRRYSEKQGISKEEGYQKGMEKFLEFVSLQVKYNLPQTSFFALSNDNYIKRPQDEKKVLIKLIRMFSENEQIKDFFINHKIRINIKGDLDEIKKLEKKTSKEDEQFIKKLEKSMEELNEKVGKEKFIVNIALNYDGQKEILHSFKQIIKQINAGELKEKSINEKTIKKNLWFNDTSSPQIIVRPGNAPRISGFLLWDSEYSEIYLTRKLWPEMNEADFVQIMNWFKEQKRNFGK